MKLLKLKYIFNISGSELLVVFYMQPIPVKLKVEPLEDNHGGHSTTNDTNFVFVLEKVK